MQVRFTANFSANLEQIAAWWDAQDFPRGVDLLLDELEQRTLPALEQHPRIGRLFMARRPTTVQAQDLWQALQPRLQALAAGAEVREYVMDDYLVLYLLLPSALHLLAIRHHRQLAFDVHDFLDTAD